MIDLINSKSHLDFLLKSMKNSKVDNEKNHSFATQKLTKEITSTLLLKSLLKNEANLPLVKESLQNFSWAKNSPSLTNELKTLEKALEKEPSLKESLTQLKRIISTLSSNDKSSLQGKTLNSGIFYESNLKKDLIPFELEKKLTSLSNVLKNAPIAKEFKEEIAPKLQKINSQNLLTSFSKELKLEVNQIVKSLENALKHSSELLNKKYPNFNLLNEIKNSEITIKQLNPSQLFLQKEKPFEKIIDLVKNLDKRIDETIIKLSQKTLKEPANMKMKLMELKSELKEILRQIEPKRAELTYTTTSSPLGQKIETKATLPTLELNVKNSNLFATIVRLNTPTILNIFEDLQTKILQATNKIKEQLRVSEPALLRVLTPFNELKDLANGLKNELFESTLKDPKTKTANDLKRVLLTIESATKGNEGAKEAYQASNRVLAQLDFHQAFSYVNHFSHTYLPYLWGGLQGGSISYKKNKDEIYCKIDLEFSKFKKVEILMALFSKNYISLTASIEHPEFFKTIQKNLKKLRELFIGVELIPHTIVLLPILTDKEPIEGFEEGFFDFKA